MTDSNGARPDPDALLRRVQAEEARERHTKLKIFFGFAPGVGKTYAMLESAQRLHAQGVDVVVGVIETHGRKETEAQLERLPLLPRKVVEYRGTQLEEFDLAQALARKPAVLLLDELAHTNAPGMQHPKRYQDVQELLEAGIEVHTTLNVQHVESLNDVVAQITQVRVRETVPDAILDRADEIELVDLPPDELLQRLREGKVYLREQAARAVDHFFQRGNLLALRELALRRTADRVDAEMQAYRLEHDIHGTWAAGERILVCVSPSPASARLARAARRMAAGLRAQWTAAYVEPIALAPLSEADRTRLDAHLQLVESLGGEVVRLTGDSISTALLAYARDKNVTRILVGKPTHPRLRDRLRGSLLDELVRGSGDIDVHVISGDEGKGPASAQPVKPREAFELRKLAWTTLLVAAATTAAFLVRGALALPDVVMLYLLVIMIVAVRFGRRPSLVAAALSVAGYDFFFVPPYYTFAISDARHMLTFAMMFGVGFVISSLTARIRQQEQNALDREARTASLYSFSRDLAAAPDEASAAKVVVEHAAKVFRSGAAVVLTAAQGSATQTASIGDVPADLAQDGVVRWVLEHGRPAGLGTDTLPGAPVLCVPLRSRAEVLGVLALTPADQRTLHQDEHEFLQAFSRQGSLAIERARFAEDAKAAALRARTEEMRSSLLSAVSHDLRTPLAAITGAATTLRDADGVALEQRSDLLQTICEEAERLERLLENLLDMTRVESGGLSVKRDWVPVEELIGSALTRLEGKLGSRVVETDLPTDLPLIGVDPVLFEQVFVNLFENAAKYTPEQTPIEVRARTSNAELVIEIADRGPGITPGDEERVFDKFYRGTHVGIGGVGLGLPICRGIVEAHGGSIRAENRREGGALFRISLPLASEAPTISRVLDSAASSGARS